MYPLNGILQSGAIDNLAFSIVPGSNKLKIVVDNAAAALKKYGSKGSTLEFIYDDNGNVIYDPTKKATITFSHLNLPLKVVFDHGGIIEFTYAADGTLLRKQVKQAASILEDRYYIGSAEYKDGKLVQACPERSRWIRHDYGRVARENGCVENQHISGLLDNTATYEGANIISDAAVVPSGVCITNCII